MNWLDLLEVQGILKSLLQHHSSKASILQHSAFFTAQLSHPYMTFGKIIALTRRTFVGKVMSLLFNMLSRLIITFLPRSNFLARKPLTEEMRYVTCWIQATISVETPPIWTDRDRNSTKGRKAIKFLGFYRQEMS